MEDINWTNDVALEQNRRDYVRRSLKGKQILEFMKRAYEQYRWIIATSDRRLRFFDINYIYYGTSLETVQAAVQKGLNGSGKRLGHRALNRKMRMQHEVQVQRNLVPKTLQNEDPEGLEFRRLSSKKQKRREKEALLLG